MRKRKACDLKGGGNVRKIKIKGDTLKDVS